MPKVKKTLGDLTELRKAVKNLPAEHKESAECLIAELSFLYGTLEKLKINIDDNGPIITTTRGQSENPALKAYNTSIMRYAQIFKQLTDMLPEPPKEPERDALLDFVEGKE